MFFWLIFTQPDFPLHAMGFCYVFSGRFWVWVGWGMRAGSVFSFWQFLCFCIFWVLGPFFGTFFGFSGHLGILRELVSYEVTRGIILVVGMVYYGYWGGLGVQGGSGGVQGGLGGSRGVCFTP